MKRDDDNDLDVLTQRAQKLAARGVGAAPRRLYERVVLVDAGRDQFGIPTACLRAIMRATPITHLPGLPSFLLGIACLRGELVSVVDLAEVRGSARTGKCALFAIVEVAPRCVAICVESVLGFRDVFEDELGTSQLSGDLEQSFTKAVTKDLLSIIDVERLLGSERLVVGRTALTDTSTGGKKS